MKFTALLLLSLLVFVSSVTAEETKRTCKIISVSGKAEIKNESGSWSPVSSGDIVAEGQFLRTGKKSKLLLNVDGEGETATLEMKENSQLLISQLLVDKAEQRETTLLDLGLGEVLIKAQKLHSEKSRFEVKTPTSIVGVRGTTFSVAVGADE